MALLPRGGSGTTDHNVLINRNIADQHPVGSITGLEDRLDVMAQHVSLNGRSDINQHPITAITGLVDALKPLNYEGVYSLSLIHI